MSFLDEFVTIGTNDIEVVGDVYVKVIGHKSDMRIIQHPVRYDISGVTTIVPKGFETNYASTPKFARWYFDNDQPESIRASVWHDYAYSRSGVLFDYSTGVYVEYTREECDAIFRDICIADGMRPAKAWAGYLAVRMGGSSHWG